MKRLSIILLTLLMLLPLAACGGDKSTSFGMVEGEDGSRAISVNGETYYDTGRAMPVEPDPSAIEYVEMPAGVDPEGTATAFAILEDGIAAVLIDEEWYEFSAEPEE